MVAARMRSGVSRGPSFAPAQARNPAAAPTAVAADAMHCMHM